MSDENNENAVPCCYAQDMRFRKGNKCKCGNHPAPPVARSGDK